MTSITKLVSDDCLDCDVEAGYGATCTPLSPSSTKATSSSIASSQKECSIPEQLFVKALPTEGPDHNYHYQDGGLSDDSMTSNSIEQNNDVEELNNEAAFYLASTMLARGNSTLPRLKLK